MKDDGSAFAKASTRCWFGDRRRTPRLRRDVGFGGGVINFDKQGACVYLYTLWIAEKLSKY